MDVKIGRWFVLCFVSTLLLVGQVFCLESASVDDEKNMIRESDVLVLTSGNFSELTKSGTWLVEFYAPWCSHCRKFMPKYEEIATDLKLKGIYTAKLDGSAHRSVFSQFKLEGFPSFLLFFGDESDRKTLRFKGKRSVEQLEEFAVSKKHSLPIDTETGELANPFSSSTMQVFLVVGMTVPLIALIIFVFSIASFSRAKAQIDADKRD